MNHVKFEVKLHESLVYVCAFILYELRRTTTFNFGLNSEFISYFGYYLVGRFLKLIYAILVDYFAIVHVHYVSLIFFLMNLASHFMLFFG